MQLHVVNAATLIAVSLMSISVRPVMAEDGAGPAPRPAEAVEAVLKVFDEHPLVGLGEAHQLKDQHEFIRALIEHPRFAGKVNDVVVEFGNARFQGLVDRYVTGEDVSPDQFKQVWQETLALNVWDAPVYKQFFTAIRAVNRKLPAPIQLRVVLGDPPVDWSQIHTTEELHAWADQREAFYAEVTKREVLRRGRKALLITGAFHLLRWDRPVPPGVPDLGPTTAVRIEKDHPGSLFLIGVHTGFFDPNNDKLERRFAGWPKPGLAPVKNTWLGKLDLAQYVPIGGPGQRLGTSLESAMDAYLYLGDKDSLTRSIPYPYVYRDDIYWSELERRYPLITGMPLDPEGDIFQVDARYAFPLAPPPEEGD